MYTKFATDKTIGEIEPVFQFHDADATGVTVANDGRIFINSRAGEMMFRSRWV